MSYQQSQDLFKRAAEVIPGGIYGHTSPVTTLPQRSPYFAERGEGCRYWDVDGNEYIDFLCGYGPMVLGYHHAEVEEAAREQRALGSCFNHPTEVMVELAEYLVEQVNFASWSVFGKNGGDMTTWATQVAREYTGRKKIIKLKGGYHGVAPWCTPGHGGLIEEDVQHVHTFVWNDIEGFLDLIKRVGEETACVILTPFHHPAFGESVMPDQGFWETIEKTCRQRGIVLILDDIRAGFRLNMQGSHEVFGFTPDIICFCKAMANGYPISAALGSAELKVASSRVFLTGSYWNSAVPMAASLATLRCLEREGSVAKMNEVGQYFKDSMTAAATQTGLTVRFTGPAAIPFMTFAGDDNFFVQQEFCALMMEKGVYLHPHHNWFIGAAHQRCDIDEAVDKAREVFAQLCAKA